MKTLQWNADAARNAQRWVDACPSGHGNTKKIPGVATCSQNMAWTSGSSVDWAKAIGMWYNEVENFNYCAPPKAGKEVGHFMNMMWADTSVIGCAAKNCGKWTICVCNYCNSRGGPASKRYCPWKKRHYLTDNSSLKNLH
ncbi:cysteine-rich venom protein latisemin-like [Paramacrobiotus metropolitanus]|uniref:cysteine-rich venom protein latisemin-like n=1 Tax=Paramacrobiotus metropolitanus TaxID=2943436 RepID=UPI0024461988|nr:cysteine-rich venom protein latisemin-like [Paramacrobiotus metropolitanus]